MPLIDKNNIQSKIKPTWCPGCGDFLILHSLQQALSQINQQKEDIVIVYGIGCSGNMADFNSCYGLHSLHGRAIANAVGIKLANHKLKVIVIGGDGDIYGEGLNHLLAASRGNHDITVLVHNNGRYSLTTGQTSPTSKTGTVSKSTPQGVLETAFNPIATLLANNSSFIARGYSTQPNQVTELIAKAITHQGFALVDILQLCPSFNKIENHFWYTQRIYQLDAGHHQNNINHAWRVSQEDNHIGLGIIYQQQRKSYHQRLPQLKKSTLLNLFPNEVDLTKDIETLK